MLLLISSIGYLRSQYNRDSVMQGNVLVTGKTGFIGGHLINKLKQSECRIYCLIRKKIKQDSNHHIVDIVGDLSRPDSLDSLSIPFDYVFHLAGHLSGGSAKTYEKINVEGVRNLYEKLVSLQHTPKRIIHVSSMAASGPSTESALRTEDQKEEPVSLYGRTKLAGEKVALEYSNRLPITVIRPGVVYGPGDRNALSIYKMVSSSLVLVPPKQPKVFSMIHVRDLVEVMQRIALLDTKSSHIYNVASDDPVNWNDLIELVSQSLGKKPKSINAGKSIFKIVAFVNLIRGYVSSGKVDILTPQKLPELFSQYWTINTYKLHQLVGDIECLDINDGIKETAKWYKEVGWI